MRRTMFSKFKVDLAATDWKQFHWQLGLRRIPAIVLLLIVGECIGQVAAGVVAAGAALSVGFAPARPVLGSRLLAMIATAICMALCGFAGILAGNSYLFTLLFAAVGGLAFAYLALGNDDTGWIAMQGLIAFLIAAYYPGTVTQGLERAGCILLGGLAQALILALVWRAEGLGSSGPEVPSAATGANTGNEGGARALFKKTAFSSLLLRFGLRVLLTLTLAVTLDHWLRLQNGYWLPMTTLIVLKPDFARTYSGAVQRVAGTLAGVVLASLITKLFAPGHAVIITLVPIFAWATFSAQKANPILFSAALTLFVILLIALTGLPESDLIWHRFLNTILGCALALGSYLAGVFSLRRYLSRAAKDSGHALAAKP